jgi:hypothetical protein
VPALKNPSPPKSSDRPLSDSEDQGGCVLKHKKGSKIKYERHKFLKISFALTRCIQQYHSLLGHLAYKAYF